MALTLRHRLLRGGMLAYGRLSRAMTLGVRAMLIENGHVLLVRHSYVPGWYFPGGGVERGESLYEALEREIAEEAGAELTGRPQLFGVYRNAKADMRDHVALFVCREWRRSAAPTIPNREIVALESFPLDALPADATAATRARIDEVLRNGPPAVDW